MHQNEISSRYPESLFRQALQLQEEKLHKAKLEREKSVRASRWARQVRKAREEEEKETVRRNREEEADANTRRERALDRKKRIMVPFYGRWTPMCTVPPRAGTAAGGVTSIPRERVEGSSRSVVSSRQVRAARPHSEDDCQSLGHDGLLIQHARQEYGLQYVGPPTRSSNDVPLLDREQQILRLYGTPQILRQRGGGGGGGARHPGRLISSDSSVGSPTRGSILSSLAARRMVRARNVIAKAKRAVDGEPMSPMSPTGVSQLDISDELSVSGISLHSP